MLKNRIFTVACIIALILPVFAVEPQSTEVLNEVQTAEDVISQGNDITPDASNLPENKVITENKDALPGTAPYKAPVSKKQIAKKFLFAMLGVVVSSLMIFGLLTVYNKVRDCIGKKESFTDANCETSLEAPDDLSGAVKSFLDKTKWQ